QRRHGPAHAPERAGKAGPHGCHLRHARSGTPCRRRRAEAHRQCRVARLPVNRKPYCWLNYGCGRRTPPLGCARKPVDWPQTASGGGLGRLDGMSDNEKRTFTDEDALAFHRHPSPGKVAVVATKPMATQRDLSLAYSPGVAVPVLRIADAPDTAYD